jgi:hypothetical protein
LSTPSGTIQVSRYLQNGSADATFGFNSSYVFNNSSTSIATSIGFQSDQKIIIGGYTGTSTTNDFLVIRLDTTGTLDLNFNTTGFKTQPLASSVTAEEANGMGIMGDDRILLAGTIVFSSAINEDVGIVMLKADSIIPSSLATISSIPVQLYPNPFDSDGFVLNLTMTQSTALITEIHDVFGRLVFTRKDELPTGSQQIRINNVNLSKGLYTVSCTTGEQLIGNFKVLAK